jgi:hypothetical protein
VNRRTISQSLTTVRADTASLMLPGRLKMARRVPAGSSLFSVKLVND